MTEIIQFENTLGQKLLGIVHLPDTNAQETGILFVHSGVQGRHGNTDQYVAYAREFCRNGFPCFRFDPNGLGDSEGIIEPMNMRDFYGAIQMGRYVEDTLRGIEEFKRLGVKQVILYGLCGGGITALLAASMSTDVKGLLLLSTPVMLDSSNVDYQLRIPKETASLHLRGYVKKIFKPKNWLRFLTFKSDYSTIYGYIKAIFRRSNKHQEKSKKSTPSVAQVNKYFFEAYTVCKDKIPIFWVFGSNDSFWYDFEREVLGEQHLSTSDKLLLIDGGNHMFTLQEWQRQIKEETSKWVMENYYEES